MVYQVGICITEHVDAVLIIVVRITIHDAVAQGILDGETTLLIVVYVTICNDAVMGDQEIDAVATIVVCSTVRNRTG